MRSSQKWTLKCHDNTSVDSIKDSEVVMSRVSFLPTSRNIDKIQD
jgi:hypothetical protein